MTRAATTDDAATSGHTATMRAVVQDEYGSAPEQVLRLAEVQRPAYPETGHADWVGETGHDVPGAPVDAGRPHPDQHLAVPAHRPGDLGQAKDLLRGDAVGVLDDGPHRESSRLGRGGGVEGCWVHGGSSWFKCLRCK